MLSVEQRSPTAHPSPAANSQGNFSEREQAMALRRSKSCVGLSRSQSHSPQPCCARVRRACCPKASDMNPECHDQGKRSADVAELSRRRDVEVKVCSIHPCFPPCLLQVSPVPPPLPGQPVIRQRRVHEPQVAPRSPRSLNINLRPGQSSGVLIHGPALKSCAEHGDGARALRRSKS